MGQQGFSHYRKSASEVVRDPDQLTLSCTSGQSLFRTRAELNQIILGSSFTAQNTGFWVVPHSFASTYCSSPGTAWLQSRCRDHPGKQATQFPYPMDIVLTKPVQWRGGMSHDLAGFKAQRCHAEG